jgi:hypothetical protein
LGRPAAKSLGIAEVISLIFVGRPGIFVGRPGIFVGRLVGRPVGRPGIFVGRHVGRPVGRPGIFVGRLVGRPGIFVGRFVGRPGIFVGRLVGRPAVRPWVIPLVIFVGFLATDLISANPFATFFVLLLGFTGSFGANPIARFVAFVADFAASNDFLAPNFPNL